MFGLNVYLRVTAVVFTMVEPIFKAGVYNSFCASVFGVLGHLHMHTPYTH